MPVHPLLFGIDKLEGSFEVAGYMGQAADLVRELLVLKGQAHQERKPQPFKIGTRSFMVQPKGRQFYEVTLKHADMILWFTDFAREGTPPVLVSISSEYLWAVGPVRAVQEVYKTLTLVGITPTGDHCSRVDPMLDYTGRPLCFKDLYDIVCSSRKRMPLDGQFLARDEYLGSVGQAYREFGTDIETGLDIRQYAIQRGKVTELTGLVVALGQPLSWRGYNKVLEIERVSGKRWFFDIWRDNGWEADDDGEMPVVFRSEFQLRREIITDLAPILGRPLDSMADVIENIPAIWKYLTCEWLQFKNRRANTKVTRAPLRRWWQQIQQPTDVDWAGLDATERLGRLRAAKRKVLDDMIAGCLAGIAAHQGTAGDLAETAKQWTAFTLENAAKEGPSGPTWGMRARKRAMEYLLAGLKEQLQAALQNPDASLPDLAKVIGRWQATLEPAIVAKFKERSQTAEGLINHGKGDIIDAESDGNRETDGGSGDAVHDDR